MLSLLLQKRKKIYSKGLLQNKGIPGRLGVRSRLQAETDTLGTKKSTGWEMGTRPWFGRPCAAQA